MRLWVMGWQKQTAGVASWARHGLWLRCAGGSWWAGRRRAVPAVRGERLAAVREWLEVGLPPVLLHRAVLWGRRARRVVPGHTGTRNADGGLRAALLQVGQSRPAVSALRHGQSCGFLAQVPELARV